MPWAVAAFDDLCMALRVRDAADVGVLRGRVSGPVHLPGEPGYEAESATSRRPALVVGAGSAADVIAAVDFAGRYDLPIEVLATGRGTQFRHDDAVLVNTLRLDELVLDPYGKTVRVGAGVRWARVAAAAARHGLAAVAGSAPADGVVGYTLGGGLSPTLGRAFGYAADHVTAIELVTADGVFRRTTADAYPELFWALRGAGRGTFGVVTALEFDLFPVGPVYGGGLMFPGQYAEQVLRAWCRWSAGLPEELSTSITLCRRPELLGRSVVDVRVIHLGAPEQGKRLLAPMREAAPILLDTVGPAPYHPRWEPTASVGAGLLLDELTPDVADRVLRLAAGMSSIELRLLGGAMGRAPRVPNAVGNRTAGYSLVASAAVPELAPWDTGGALVNWLTGEDARNGRMMRAFDPEAWARLRRLKSTYDPRNLFRVGATIPPSP